MVEVAEVEVAVRGPFGSQRELGLEASFSAGGCEALGGAELSCRQGSAFVPPRAGRHWGGRGVQCKAAAFSARAAVALGWPGPFVKRKPTTTKGIRGKEPDSLSLLISFPYGRCASRGTAQRLVTLTVSASVLLLFVHRCQQDDALLAVVS